MSTYHPHFVSSRPRSDASLPAPNVRPTPVFRSTTGERTAASLQFKSNLMSTGGQHHPAVPVSLFICNQPKQDLGEDYGFFRRNSYGVL